MRDLTSDDGKYYAVQQDDGNFVVYKKPEMIPLWDKWSYIAYNQEITPTTPISTEPSPIPVSNHPNSSEPVELQVETWIRPFGMAYWLSLIHI